jgi:asparagine synthase (glutamine-hydrolysing)
MCGFVGYRLNQANQNFDRSLIIPAIETIHYRGPDHTGIWNSPCNKITLAHKRLSILDLSDKGNQPLLNQENDIAVVLNGEIYNYINLKKELLLLGAKFTSTSDTEVINAGYAEWGSELFSKLEGMFSLAIIDNKNSKIYLARDRVGEKPLFFCEKDRSIFFASEIKPLIALEILDKQVDFQSLNSLFSRGYCPSSQSIFSEISKLDAAHYLEFDCKTEKYKIEKYWDLEKKISRSQAPYQNDEVLINKLEALLEASVDKQLNADVPVGMLLSGGVDSSLLVALGSRNNSNLSTFNVAFNNHAKFNESDHARLISDSFNCNHHEIEGSTIDPMMFDRLVEYYDDPIFDTSMIPTFLLSHAVSKHCKVAIGGDGGDELFGGYPHYDKLLRIKRNASYLPLSFRSNLSSAFQYFMPIGFKGKKTLEFYGTDLEKNYPNFAEFYSADEMTHIFNTKKILNDSQINQERFSNVISRDFIKHATLHDFSNYLKNDLLVKVDRASMANSLEIRSPFLDKSLIEFAFLEVPSSSKVTLHKRKLLLKKLAAKILPKDFNYERKQGFSIPLNTFLTQPIWSDYFYQKVADSDPSVFNHKYIFKLLKSFGRYRNNGERVAALIFFICWVEKYKPKF